MRTHNPVQPFGSRGKGLDCGRREDWRRHGKHRQERTREQPSTFHRGVSLLAPMGRSAGQRLHPLPRRERLQRRLLLACTVGQLAWRRLGRTAQETGPGRAPRPEPCPAHGCRNYEGRCHYRYADDIRNRDRRQDHLCQRCVTRTGWHTGRHHTETDSKGHSHLVRTRMELQGYVEQALLRGKGARNTRRADRTPLTPELCRHEVWARPTVPLYRVACHLQGNAQVHLRTKGGALCSTAPSTPLRHGVVRQQWERTH